MKKNKSFLLLLPFLLLSSVGCNEKENTSNSSATEQEKDTSDNPAHKPTDEELSKVDDVFSYDNFMKMPGGQETADPFVFRFNGKYYLYPTTSGRAVRCYVSDDMINWEACDNGINGRGFCYEYSTDGSSAPASQIPFAPEVTYFNGSFYMIMSPSGNGHYILKADNPDGPYSCITENVGRSIDGSFFITDDERILMYGAGSGCIQAYELTDDFSDFKTNDNGDYFSGPIGACHMGGWNEGPYLLNRYGEYYMTWTGTNYINRDYRVDYCYAEKGSNLLSSSSFTRKKTILLETGDSFWGLGHSCTVLGPDLDSYFLVYHNLMDDKRRFYNISRLSFYSDRLAVNGARANEIPFVEKAKSVPDSDHLVEENGAYLLDAYSSDTFSVEFNNVGEGRMVFSYLDSNHYGYLDFSKDKIILGKKLFDEEVVKEIPLKKKYRLDVVHSFLLQYREGYVALYFDHMEKLSMCPVTFEPGKVGYLIDNRFERILSTSLSRFAFGSSEEEYYKDHILLANSFDSKLSKGVSMMSPYLHLSHGKCATYRIYVPKNGEYEISAVLRKGYLFKQFSLQVGKLLYPIYLEEESGAMEDRVLLATVHLNKGLQTLSLIGEDDISFTEIDFENVEDEACVNFDFTRSIDETDFFFRNKMIDTANGLETSDDISSGILYEKEYHNDKASITFVPESIEKNGSLSLLYHASDFCNNFIEDGDGKDNPHSYRGFELALTCESIVLRKVDFNFTYDLMSYSYHFVPNQEIDLSLKMIGNNLVAYLDGNEIFSYVTSKGNFHGLTGFLAYKAKGVLSSMKIEKANLF